MDYTTVIKHPYRVPLRSAQCADSVGCPVEHLYGEELQPQQWTDKTTAFAGRHILRVVTLSLRSKLKSPHHMLI
jgi:hypothetical protein